MRRLATTSALVLILWANQLLGAPVEFGGLDEVDHHVAPYGPQSPSAPLPPEGPIAPGEQPEEASEAAPPPPAAMTAGAEHEAQARTERPLEPGTRRPEPDFGVPGQPTTFGDVALWTARVALFPLYGASDYLVRRPVGYAATEAEKHYVPAVLMDFFTFYADRHAGLVPVVLLDFGFRPAAGLYLFWNRFLGENNELRTFGATGGARWWDASLVDRWEFAPGQQLLVGGVLELRPDWIFDGFGPGSRNANESRFSKDKREARLRYRADLWRTSTFESWLALRDVRIDAATGCCGDPTLDWSVRSGRLAAPPGIHGYTVLRQSMLLELDSRKDRFPQRSELGEDYPSPSGTGVQLDLHAANSSGQLRGPVPAGADSRRLDWVNYGAMLGGYVDLTGKQRTLGLQLFADFAEPLTGSAIPFTEQVSLGGARPLRGFLERRLVDRSAVAARLSYTWPVWVWLDGELAYEVGNVFGTQLRGFDAALLRSSYGLGLRAADRRDHAIELLVACGSRTFRDGAGLESLRLLASAMSRF
jgi:hypothetical protein